MATTEVLYVTLLILIFLCTQEVTTILNLGFIILMQTSMHFLKNLLILLCWVEVGMQDLCIFSCDMWDLVP